MWRYTEIHKNPSLSATWSLSFYLGNFFCQQYFERSPPCNIVCSQGGPPCMGHLSTVNWGCYFCYLSWSPPLGLISLRDGIPERNLEFWLVLHELSSTFVVLIFANSLFVPFWFLQVPCFSMLMFASSSFFPCWFLQVLYFVHVGFCKFFIFPCWCLQTLNFSHYQIWILKVQDIPNIFFLGFWGFGVLGFRV